jgi:polyhydroxyalkanoate synthesis repressor PhaR
VATEQQAEGGPGEAGVVTVIRYPNRRLYDRSQARYVTLQDVEETVRRGRTVTVRDSKTGEDLTRSILAQIILERYPERMELVPVDFLHLVIRANEVVLGGLREYVRQSLAYFDMMQRAAVINPIADLGNWMRAVWPGLPPQGQPGPSSPGAGPDAEALARRVAELERRLEELHAAAGKPDPKAPSGADRPNRAGGPQDRADAR